MVLRSSADETGCLLSAGNKMARLIGRRGDRRPNELHRATRGLVGSCEETKLDGRRVDGETRPCESRERSRHWGESPTAMQGGHDDDNGMCFDAVHGRAEECVAQSRLEQRHRSSFPTVRPFNFPCRPLPPCYARLVGAGGPPGYRAAIPELARHIFRFVSTTSRRPFDAPSGSDAS